jgi:hypothetical protein
MSWIKIKIFIKNYKSSFKFGGFTIAGGVTFAFGKYFNKNSHQIKNDNSNIDPSSKGGYMTK